MTSLFQIVIDAGGAPDVENDDLREDAEGFVWTCPTLWPVIDRWALTVAASRILGPEYRGCEATGDEVTVYITPDWGDE